MPSADVAPGSTMRSDFGLAAADPVPAITAARATAAHTTVARNALACSLRRFMTPPFAGRHRKSPATDRRWPGVRLRTEQGEDVDLLVVDHELLLAGVPVPGPVVRVGDALEDGVGGLLGRRPRRDEPEHRDVLGLLERLLD